jgi:hypothetical protein
LIETRSPTDALKVNRMLSPAVDVDDVTDAPPAVIVPVTSAARAGNDPALNRTAIATASAATTLTQCSRARSRRPHSTTI